MIEYDLLGHITGEILSQYDNKGFLRSCVYFLKKNSPTECNYKIHDKELLVVIWYLKE